MSKPYKPIPGARVRVTRREPGGRIKFIKTGTVGKDVTERCFEFHDDDGYHVYCSSDRDLAEGMRGWTQTTEPIH